MLLPIAGSSGTCNLRTNLPVPWCLHTKILWHEFYFDVFFKKSLILCTPNNLSNLTMSITIRKAKEADFETVLDLIRGLAVFQGMPEKVTNTVELMKEEKSYFQCLVAQNEEKEIIGIASYFYAYYTWCGKSLYLDDLYVKEESRGLKAGTALLDKLFEIAKEENCKRVRWMVSHWNKPAIEFYKKCGAEIDEELFICDFDSHGIKNYLARKQ